MKRPTKLKKMKLNSVDFVRRGANPAADIALYKSYDGAPDDEEEGNHSFFKSIADGITNVLKKAFSEEEESVDLAKAENDLTAFTKFLGESFSSIMKDDTLSNDERIGMIAKSMSEFNDTMDDYLSSFDKLEKSNPDQQVTVNTSKIEKGDVEQMEIKLENVDKSLLSPEEAAQLDALIEKACTTEKACGKETCQKEDMKPGKVNPEAAQEEEEKNAELPPEVKKALEEVQEMKKSYEMTALTEIAKKYEILGKKADDEAKILYDLKKSGDSNYNAYVAALDAQVDMVQKSGMFTEIGKSGNFNYGPVAKSEPETKIEGIAKSYMDKDPTLDYNGALAKAWENNPQLMAEYDASFMN